MVERCEKEISTKPDILKPETPRALLVGFGDNVQDSLETLEELAFLADTAGAEVVGRIHQRRSTVHPGKFLSKGKIEDAKELVREHDANFLICDEDLSPAQVRNLEKALEVRVIDRSELILDIFAQRAQTREARIQVELAQLQYLLPRLVGMWGHLARTGGGIGTRGPGETQLEVDRRAVRHKITVLQKRLEGVEKERDTQSRRRSGEFRVALVGYTNAGKSTLFNRLTRSDVLEENKLFATLDTTTRKLFLDGRYSVLISDTVGFIRKLPHHLVASFKATLREVETADLLLHLVDGSHPSYRKQIEAVDEVLDSIMTEERPRLLVFNKADVFTSPVPGGPLGTDGAENSGGAGAPSGLADPDSGAGLEPDSGGAGASMAGREEEIRLAYPDSLRISALDAADRDRLRGKIAEKVRELRTLVRVECDVVRLPKLRELTRRGETRSEGYTESSVWSEFWLDEPELVALRRAGFRVEAVRAR
ncbi:MAG: GTPase HflX [Candidatus Eisenbacteria bacterium]